MYVTAEKMYVTEERTAGIAGSDVLVLFLIHPFYINRPRHLAGFIIFPTADCRLLTEDC